VGWPWPFSVTWRHRTRNIRFVIGFFLLVVLCYRASIYIGFWRYWTLNIYQYPRPLAKKIIIISMRGKVTEGPGWLRYATVSNKGVELSTLDVRFVLFLTDLTKRHNYTGTLFSYTDSDVGIRLLKQTVLTLAISLVQNASSRMLIYCETQFRHICKFLSTSALFFGGTAVVRTSFLF